MNISKQVIRRLARVEILSDITGRLRLRIANYDKISSQAPVYAGYVKKALCLFKYIEEVTFNSTIGTVVVTYDKRFISSETVMLWINTVIDTAVEHMDELSAYWPDQADEAEEKAMNLLKAKLDEMMVR